MSNRICFVICMFERHLGINNNGAEYVNSVYCSPWDQLPKYLPSAALLPQIEHCVHQRFLSSWQQWISACCLRSLHPYSRSALEIVIEIGINIYTWKIPLKVEPGFLSLPQCMAIADRSGGWTCSSVQCFLWCHHRYHQVTTKIFVDGRSPNTGWVSRFQR